MKLLAPTAKAKEIIVRLVIKIRNLNSIWKDSVLLLVPMGMGKLAISALNARVLVLLVKIRLPNVLLVMAKEGMRGCLTLNASILVLLEPLKM